MEGAQQCGETDFYLQFWHVYLHKLLKKAARECDKHSYKENKKLQKLLTIYSTTDVFYSITKYCRERPN